MKPRQCPKCQCYVADQLKQCPRCGKKVKQITAADTEEEKQRAEAERLERLNRDAKVIDGRKIKWAPPVAAQKINRERVIAIRKRRKKGERNLRAELLACKAIARIPRAGRWSWEPPPKRYDEKGNVIVTKGQYQPWLISPKGNRYVRAHPNERADLILDYGRPAGYPNGLTIRLRRAVSSSQVKAMKKEVKEAQRRALAKKEKRKAKKAKRKLLKKLAS